MNETTVLLVTIVDSGSVEETVRTAEAKGAKDSVAVRGRGKHLRQVDTILGSPLDVARDLVLTILPAVDASTVQDAIFDTTGLKTDGHGLVCKLPLVAFAEVEPADERGNV